MSETTLAPPTRKAVRLLASTHVGLRDQGPVLLGRDLHRSRPATLLDLMLLQRLASGPVTPGEELAVELAEVAGVTPEEAAALWADLEERELLVPADQIGRSVGDRGWAPAEEVAPPGDDVLLRLATPVVLRVAPEGFVALDGDGRRIAELSPVEMTAVAVLGSATTLADARLRDTVAQTGLSPEDFDALVLRLLARGLVRAVQGEVVSVQAEHSRKQMRDAVGQKMRLRKAVDADLARLDELEAEHQARTGVARVPVIPIHHQGNYLPLGLGMILSHLKARCEGPLGEHFQVRPDWVAADRTVAELTEQPAVFLFSNYLWSHSRNLELSRSIKQASPTSLTIHGGPDVPKYEDDLVAYLDRHPHVDIAVHGEGEVAVPEILEALGGSVGGDGPIDLSPLLEVPGLSFRHDGRVVRTGARERLADLNVIPSPFLNGIYEAYRGLPNTNVVLETNRGCPYGCTFCDWGTVTNARIRKFDMDRVLGELEWCATSGVVSIALADANFGIFERDVEIAAKVVELKGEHGFPLACTGSYAKNTVKHLEQIIGMWVDAGMLTLGVLSLQSLDPTTLEAVHRSNIKTEKYDLIARQFRRRKLPLYVDLMVGLPGATVATFLDDLQNLIDREVQGKIHETVLLPNSPMNDPGYRAEHGIQIRRPGAPGSEERDPAVVATSTMSESDLAFVHQLTPMYVFAENFGVLRHIARYIRHETGTREADVYLHLAQRAQQDPGQWPALDFLANSMKQFMAPPASWKLLTEEVGELAVSHFGVADDDALRAVLDVQRVLLPSVGRPQRIELTLPHDYAAWHEQMIEAKLDALDWPSIVPPLRDLPPARFVVEDPLGLSEQLLGLALGSAWFDSWDLVSPVARPSVLGDSASQREEAISA